MVDRAKLTALGLQRGRVELRAHHNAWARAFQKECKRLVEAVGTDGYFVEHIGSTSVAGLPSKPILDIALRVRHPELLQELKRHLSSIGYLYRGNNTENGGHLFVLEKSPEVRAIHLHAIFDSDPQWSDYLQFRDILRSNADLRGKYADLKSHLATAFPGDRKKYTAGKASFIKAALSGKSH